MSKTPANRTIWIDRDDPTSVVCIDQRLLPFEYQEVSIRTSGEMTTVIADMVVRGAGCIGVSAGYGMYLAALATLWNGRCRRRRLAASRRYRAGGESAHRGQPHLGSATAAQRDPRHRRCCRADLQSESTGGDHCRRGRRLLRRDRTARARRHRGHLPAQG